ncbi:hypothetical protein [Pseudarthrobacter sp. BRE9]|uniref:hypothetical protein n=1 Tax=Pseudarthrobacter sp. BRE9 TaxID=2962582 RepID=UPI002881E631|nr:hypothetical protein [Pseudarthrobacter sp. BRE9]MDT0169450.1 hypothetical protein [Pseudarthrobacter sp. BRE9]
MTISVGKVADKIAAVALGAELAKDERADVLVVVDNDVYLAEGAIEMLLQAYRRSEVQAAAATKAPLITRDSTEFQRLYSYAVQESFRSGIFPKRPTGSLYAIHPAIVPTVLPLGHAESDRLAAIGAARSRALVQSPYAEDYESEVERRVRHWLHAERHGYSRLHSTPDFAKGALSVPLPSSVDRRRFQASMNLWRAIHSTAAVIATKAQDHGNGINEGG